MKLKLEEHPRVFGVKRHEVKDFGKIFLDNDEMVSFKTKSGKEYDFVAKEWGFYASPSVNSRLKKEGFKTALVVNENNQLYVMAVEENKIPEFKKYLKDNQDNRIVCWLDQFFMEED
ncbi:MAG: hypothetical protein NTW78_10835 [Campylobacterales bacterium]|nr:hypothetical protein [Campylobacterales bacterium]